MKKSSKLVVSAVSLITLTSPFLASAQGMDLTELLAYSTNIKQIINWVIMPVFMAIAFIVFLWGIYRYFILGAANESDKAEGRKFAMWGIIGFVIILSLWGIVNILQDALNLKGGKSPNPPTIGTPTTAGAVQNDQCRRDGNVETCPGYPGFQPTNVTPYP